MNLENILFILGTFNQDFYQLWFGYDLPNVLKNADELAFIKTAHFQFTKNNFIYWLEIALTCLVLVNPNSFDLDKEANIAINNK